MPPRTPSATSGSASGSTVVNRKDWGIEWNAPLETGGVLVSEKITIEVEVSAIQVMPEA